MSQTGWTIDSGVAAQPTRKWTFLVFLNAANDLEPYATLNMNQMESVGSSSNVNIVVQYKRMGGEYDTTGGTWTDTRRYFVNKGSATLLSERSGVDMGSYSTLEDFTAWATQAYPAQHYAIVMWSHGNGWRAQSLASATAKFRGISYDDATGDHITIPQLSTALATFGQKWDIVAFDACLMQMAEVDYQLKDVADYVNGAEGDTPANGYPYDTILNDLTANSGYSTLGFATAIAKDDESVYASEGDSTQSVFDTTKAVSLTSAINNFGSVLLTRSQASATEASQIAEIREYTQNYDSDYEDFRDLYTFARLLAAPTSSDISYGMSVTSDSAVTAAASAVLSAVQSAAPVVDNASQYSASGGISIYLPSPAEYKSDLAEQQEDSDIVYTNLAFATAAPNWVNYLQNAPK